MLFICILIGKNTYYLFIKLSIKLIYMKKIGIVIFVVLLSQWVWAQEKTTNITYTYDAAGNRTNRSLTVKEPKLDSTTNKEDSTFYSLVENNSLNGEQKLMGNVTTIQQQIDLIAAYDLKVFPNPTEGKLQLVIGNYSNALQGEIRLYQLTGSLLLTQKTISNRNIIDLSGMSVGSYMLELVIAGKKVVWKVIKK